jgi:hypothetical protein
MSVNLQYTYAQINTSTGLCLACATTSYQINHPAYVLVPTLDDYVGKYYNSEDQNWYLDQMFTQPWEEAPQW